MDSVARCHHPGHGPAGEGAAPAFEAIEIERMSNEIAMARLDLEIAPMREYRSRLVAEGVTGKLDLRPAACHLPAEIEPAEIPPNAEEAQDIDSEFAEVK